MPSENPADRYKSSHWGIPHAKIHEVDDPNLPDELVEMGKLLELGVLLEDEDGTSELEQIEFGGHNICAFEPSKSERLYLVLDRHTRRLGRKNLILRDAPWTPLQKVADEIGGSQNAYSYIDVEVQAVGPLVNIVYHTHKKGDGPSDYIHTFGKNEDGKTEIPWLCIDDSGRLWVAGGGYDVPDAGIRD
jgi:hypothetical protein